jgi:hypothetical protein
MSVMLKTPVEVSKVHYLSICIAFITTGIY